MPNLVGIGNSQVPTNAMLGGLAYQDPGHAVLTKAELGSIAEMNSTIPRSAHYAFIYNTKYDSDGGAWRKRCQHTSWYNETLGTDVRGNRREFPSVAIIVIYSTSAYEIAIYDADQPGCPLWMRFPAWNFYGDNTRNVMYGCAFPRSLYMLNGILVTGSQASNFWPLMIDFIQDDIIGLRADNHLVYTNEKNNIHLRNTMSNDSTQFWHTKNRGTRKFWFDGVIRHAQVNDVVMDVRPDARINPDTGIAIPDIYLITAGGMSHIQSGTDATNSFLSTVQDFYSSSSGEAYSHGGQITITDENFLWFQGDRFDPAGGSSYWTYFRDSYAVSLKLMDDNNSNRTFSNVSDDMDQSWTGHEGKEAYSVTTGNEGGSIKIGYANGWAWDHMRRNGLGGPLGFALHKRPVPDFNDWQNGSYNPTYEVENRCLAALITHDRISGWMGTGTSGSFSWLGGTSTSNKTTGTDNILDLGHNGRALDTTGTINFATVADGAELCAASGFSSSNQVKKIGQTINFGSPGTFTMMGWIKNSNTTIYSYILSMYDGTHSEGAGLAMASSAAGSNEGTMYFYSTNHTTIYSTGVRIDDGGWHHVAGVMEPAANRKSLYIDGIKRNETTPSNRNYTSVNMFHLGAWSANNSPAHHCAHGSIALCKLHIAGMTDEQIRTIYNDELPLFKDNAKCTLYGSSNVITGLAYDKGTGLYHVGTSAGRSDFRGLERINNTTTPITHTIAADDGMIVER